MERRHTPMEHRNIPMEERPVFMPRVNSDNLVKTDMVHFERHVGFSSAQKRKSINDHHSVIRKKYGFKKVLELSSKSKDKLSVPLSGFYLKLTDQDTGQQYSVENIFQSSKVFEHGGPYTDLLTVPPRKARKDERLQNSGKLIGYKFQGIEWDVGPLTAFYDWLYVNALKQNSQLHDELMQYQAFTDMTFNPKRAVHCEAYSLAMFVALKKRELLDKIAEPIDFFNLYSEFPVSNTEYLFEGE